MRRPGRVSIYAATGGREGGGNQLGIKNEELRMARRGGTEAGKAQCLGGAGSSVAGVGRDVSTPLDMTTVSL